MKIVSTSDVPLDELRRFAAQLDPDLEPNVDSNQISLRSLEPPSWIRLLAEASWWTQVLGAAAAVYVAELIKEAAKETWRNRGKIAAAGTAAGSRIAKLAEGVAAWRRERSAFTTLGIGLPVPNDFFSTTLVLEGVDADILAVQIALFVHHLPALTRLIASEKLADAATGVFLRLRDDGAVLVSWHDSHTLEVHEHALDLTMWSR